MVEHTHPDSTVTSISNGNSTATGTYPEADSGAYPSDFAPLSRRSSQRHVPDPGIMISFALCLASSEVVWAEATCCFAFEHSGVRRLPDLVRPEFLLAWYQRPHDQYQERASRSDCASHSAGWLRGDYRTPHPCLARQPRSRTAWCRQIMRQQPRLHGKSA